LKAIGVCDATLVQGTVGYSVFSGESAAMLTVAGGRQRQFLNLSYQRVFLSAGGNGL